MIYRIQKKAPIRDAHHLRRKITLDNKWLHCPLSFKSVHTSVLNIETENAIQNPFHCGRPLTDSPPDQNATPLSRENNPPQRPQTNPRRKATVTLNYTRGGDQGEATKTRIHEKTETLETGSCGFKSSYGDSSSLIRPTKQMGKNIYGYTPIWVIGAVG